MLTLYKIPLKKIDGVKTVVVGGKQGVKQDYCGTIGGNSIYHLSINSDIFVRF